MKYLYIVLAIFLPFKNSFSQNFSPDDYCLIWADEFNGTGAPDSKYWSYEEGYLRNNEDQYYTKGRLENARMEGGKLIIEARKDNWNGHAYTSASLITSGKVVKQYGRFEIRAKVDFRKGSWPAFWTLGQSGEWPSNGEIDIMEYYGGNLHGNVAWGSATRWQGIWNSKTRDITTLPPTWTDSFHVFRMEWTPEFIHLFVDDVLLNTTDLRQTINQSGSSVTNPFKQPHYIVLNQAIGGNNGGDPSSTAFPVRFEVEYIRIYQKGSCHLDCAWQEGGSAYEDNCTNCVGGSTGKKPCSKQCPANLVMNSGLEAGTLSSWTGWGDRSVTTTTANVFNGKSALMAANGSAEQVVPVKPGTKYLLKVKGKKSGAGWYRLGVKDHGSLESFVENTNTNWQDVTLEFTTGSTTSARIYFYNGNGGSAYADNFSLLPAGCELISGTDEAMSSKENIKVYPNPSANEAFLISDANGTLKVFDGLGRLMEQRQVAEKITFGEHLAPGIYTLHFQSEEVIKTIQWIKQ